MATPDEKDMVVKAIKELIAAMKMEKKVAIPKTSSGEVDPKKLFMNFQNAILKEYNDGNKKILEQFAGVLKKLDPKDPDLKRDIANLLKATKDSNSTKSKADNKQNEKLDSIFKSTKSFQFKSLEDDKQLIKKTTFAAYAQERTNSTLGNYFKFLKTKDPITGKEKFSIKGMIGQLREDPSKILKLGLKTAVPAFMAGFGKWGIAGGLGVAALTHDFEDWSEENKKQNNDILTNAMLGQKETFNQLKAIEYAIKQGSELTETELKKLTPEVKEKILIDTAKQLESVADELRLKFKEGSQEFNAAMESVIDDFSSSSRGNIELLKATKSRVKDPLAEKIRMGTVQALNVQKKAETEPILPRAKGGLVERAKTYLVGEKGPELFTAGSTGNIIPNDKLGTRADSSKGILNQILKNIIGINTEFALFREDWNRENLGTEKKKEEKGEKKGLISGFLDSLTGLNSALQIGKTLFTSFGAMFPGLMSSLSMLGSAAAIAGVAFGAFKLGSWINDKFIGTSIGDAVYEGLDKAKGVFGESDKEKFARQDKEAEANIERGKKNRVEQTSKAEMPKVQKQTEKSIEVVKKSTNIVQEIQKANKEAIKEKLPQPTVTTAPAPQPRSSGGSQSRLNNLPSDVENLAMSVLVKGWLA